MTKPFSLILKIFLVLAVAGIAFAVYQNFRPIGPDSRTLFDGYDGKTPLNIVWIGVDNLRPDALSSYNSLDAETPFIDKFAKKGAAFHKFFHQTPMLVPNVVSLMTGLPPAEHGVRNNTDFHILPEHLTFAERLKARGYRTLAFVGATEYRRGRGLERGFDLYEDSLIELSGIQRANYILRVFSKILNEKIFHEFTERPLTDKQPFFLWVQYADLSHPYAVSKEPGKKTLDDPYQVRVRELDKNVGALMKELKKRGLLENTIIVLSGSKPEYFGEHKVTLPGTSLYNSHLATPLIIASPKFFNSPVAVDSLWTAQDVMPTLFDLMKLPKPQGVSGKSALTEILDGPLEENKSRHIMLETMMPVENYGVSPKYGILTEKQKWLRNSPTEFELYDLGVDSFEINNIQEKRPEDIKRFDLELATYLRTVSFKNTQKAYVGAGNASTAASFKALFQELSGRPYEGKSWVSYLGEEDSHSLAEAERNTRNALKAAEIRNVTDAITVLERWLSGNENDFTHSLLLSQLTAADTTRAEDTLAYAWKAVELNPLVLASYSWLSQFYAKAGDMDRAKRVWHLAFLVAPQRSPARIYAAIDYLRNKDYAAAEALGKEVEAYSLADASSFWAILSERAEKEKEMEKAYDYMARSLKANPKNIAALKRRAIFSITQNKWKEGFPDLKRFIALDPDQGHATLLQLVSFYGTRVGKPDLAREFAKEFEAELKGTVHEELMKAYFFKLEEKPLEAAKVLEKALKKKITPEVRLALLNNLGALYMMMGEKEKARGYFQTLLDEEPYEPTSANSLAWLLAEDSYNIPLAQQWIQKSLSLDSSSPQYLGTLAKIYQLNQQPFYAAKVAKEAVMNATPWQKARYKARLREYVRASRASQK